MSDEIDLEANNLCTTEDAFEKFQSVSMYEEDEYITLSDIVSSSQNKHEVTEIFTDSLGNNDFTPEEIVQEERGPKILLTTPLPEENTTNPPQIIQKKPNSKRVRNKKKRDIQSNISDESNFISLKVLDHNTSNMDKDLSKNEQKIIANTSENSKSTTEYTQINSFNELVAQHKPTKRRGRPPKSINICTPTNKGSENVLQNESEGESNVSKRFSRRNKKKNIDCTTHKSLRNDEVGTDVTKQDLDSEKQQSIDKKCTASPLKEPNISEHIQIKKKKSNSKGNISDDDIEDLPLVALCTKSTKIKKIAGTVDNLKSSTKMEENKLSSNIIINHEKQIDAKTNLVSKSWHKKRGRPRKSQKCVINPNIDDKIKNHNQQNNEQDEISLSKLKDATISDDTDVPMIIENNKEVITPMQNLEEKIEKNIINKRNLKKPVMSDYEYNIDTIISNEINDIADEKPNSSDSQLVESSRPVRRKAKKNLHYDEGSDEDPFANVELSDDEPRRRKRGGRFYSDDEYIPDGGKSGNRESELTDTDTNIEEEVLDDVRKPRKKKYRKSYLALQKSLKKVSKQNLEDTSGLNNHIDVELNLETSVIKIDDDKKCEQNNSWGATNEFENFLAKIVQGTDIKIKKANSIDSTKTPLQIPTIDPMEEKKSLEVSSQTDNVKTKSISVQTNNLHEIPMKNQVALTAEQSQKAIEFLSGIVKTTSELGQLMTEKSEDFIAKKINSSYVTDTFKMDYCVKKSFLLFKLAKHNLLQMEEDLSKQYGDFLKENNLIQHREEQKVISSTSKDSDSDCEIVEEPVKKKAKEKIPFNPKTVFLNKELSIKIAKKPTETPKAKEKINIKGRHTVWINDSVMVKKVKPTQSFLAQDSRNKKPPDTLITMKMVSDFFKMYERQKAVSLCAPYINNIFYQGETNYICNYFFEITNKPLESYTTPNTEIEPYNEIGSNEINNPVLLSDLNRSCPDSLLSICMKVLQRVMNFKNALNCETHSKDNVFLISMTRQYINDSAVSLEDLNTNDNKMNIIIQKRKICSVPTLKVLCYNRISQLIYVPNFSENEKEKVTANFMEKSDNHTTCENNDILYCTKKSYCNIMKVKSLLSMCVMVLQNHFNSINKIENVKTLHKVNTLRHLSLKTIKKIFYHDLKTTIHKSVQDRNEINPIKSLSLLCLELIYDYNAPSGMLQTNGNQIPHEISLKSLSLEKVISLMNNGIQNDSILNFTIDNVNTVSEDIFLENSGYNNEHEIASSNDENCYSDNDLDANYQDDLVEETNWVAQVQMQELRSCLDFAKDNFVETIDNCLVNVKIEPLDDFAGNTIDANTVKTEPVEEHENLENFASIDVITKQEDVVAPEKPVQRKFSYDEEQFETFVASNKMMTAVANSDDEEIFSQSVHRIRRQYEPDSDDDIDTFSDTMNLLIPQSDETAKDRLMASSSDEGSNKKTSNKKKIERRKPKMKKNKCQMEPTKEKTTEKIEMLTRKMKEKIRIEEKKRNCSDSEVDDVDLNLKKKKNDDRVTDKSSSDPVNNFQEKEIQCNDVDSTEQIIESQSEKKNKVELTPFFPTDEPIELLQCTPSIISEMYGDGNHVKSDSKTSNNTDSNEVTYIDRYGWSCYPIDDKDSKIYQYAYIPLEKLPESFVETYNKYLSISAKSYIDSEIDKLTNLQSLHRHTNGNVRKTKNVSVNKFKSHNAEANNHSDNDIKSQQCQELSLSEDEGEIVDNFGDYIPEQNSENNFAKNLLMNNDSDGEEKKLKIKVEPKEKITVKSRSGRLIKPTRRVEEEQIKPKSENVMLTADKVMDKDLKLLHAPIKIEFKQEPMDAKDIDNKPNTRNCNKKPPKSNIVKIRIREDDASSSEEEKQWFTTKEKLLKRLGKKLDTPSVDDAKRAKIVSEFIEKRNDGIETTRKRSRPRGRSKKKLLERRKQMEILSMELFGDGSHSSKKYQSQTYSKGRRNIRKVLDKKSLSRSTVLANMDEFERKRRLVQREAQLREVLGCEEGVNVVVINDELCLEYDFENKLPLVTVHSFFTKVMKAHQYEGVKFMWDACFESVSAMARGGGGCILAHCMGLGKTLQVLALLHTVLMHPQLSMRRVLVCCPLSTVLNWVDEINKWIGPVTDKIKVFELSKLKKTYERAYQLEDWYNGGGIFIIGYELFRSLTTLDPVMDRVRPTIINKIRTALLDPGPDIIICDEGHLLKNDSSVLAVAMSRVVTKRRIMLTGTPMQNNLREYYCMVNFVKPNLLGTYSEYSNRFENPIMNGQHRDSREEDIKLMKARTHILHKVLEGCLQRQEASVLYSYLPKKYEYTVFISQTRCQWDLYKHYLKNYVKGTKQSVLKDFHILQKIWTHPQVLHSFMTRARGDEKEVKIKAEKIEDDLAREDLIASEDIKPNATETWWPPHVADSNSLDSLESSNKFLVVFHLLDECIALDDKVLIFSTSLYTMDSLEYFLRRIKQWSLSKEYYRLDGSVPAEVRQKWCREFNAPNNTTTKLFLISTRAGSLGLNMTAANRVIILDTSWNPAHDIQSIFRVYRFGQKKDCYIYRLVAMGTMEQKMYERSVTKQAVACRVVDEQEIDRHYNMAELSELYRLDEDGYTVAAGLAPGVRDGVLLRVARTLGTTEGPGEVNACLHAVQEHDSLLRGSEETGLPEHERNAAWMQFQQEHSSTHNNIQNIEIKIPSIQNNDNDQRDIQVKEEPTDKPKRNNLRSNKGKKSVNVENDVTAVPSTSAQIDPSLDPDIEEETVKKIMSILIKHKFHEAKGPIEIPLLITKVRNVVANIDESGLDNVDPLIASIAKVLIDSEKPTVNDTKPLVLNSLFNTDMDVKPALEVTVSCNVRAGADDFLGDCESGRKRKNQKADSDDEYVPEPGTSRAPRKKKKIKIVDKNTNKKSNATNISDNPQMNSELTNTMSYGVQNTILMQDAQSLPNNESSRDLDSDRENTNINNKQTAMSIDTNYKEDISIILSDDESDRETIRKKSNIEEVKLVPLHKSLLTNKNFIKIVAHTYLTGNPKLDEDAAVLAAQYSTFKALKEVEMTGKDIDSGPIYDIATQVLGMPLLEKLQSIHENKQDDVIDINEETSLSISSVLAPNDTTTSTQIDQTGVTIQLNSNDNKSTPKTSKKAKKPNFQKDQKSDNSFRIEPVLSENLTTASPAPTEVVPVGMFIGPASFQPSDPPAHEECILPDDDDIILTDSMPATTTPLNINRKRVNSKIVVNNVSSVSKPPLAGSSAKSTDELIRRTPGPFGPDALLKSKRKSMCTPKTTTTQSTKQNQNAIVKIPILHQNSLPKTAPKSNQSSEKLNETICLDSDEEETIVPTPKPKAKALKSTTKLPSLLISKENSNITVLNAQFMKKITPQIIVNTEKNETRETSDATNAVTKKEASSKLEKIIRISEGGEIELLRRTEIVPTQPKTVISKEEKNKPRILKTPKNNINNTNTKPVGVHNVNDSDDENPISVFQNVVHIHADKYEEMNKAITIEEPEKITPITIKDGTKSIKIKLNKPQSTDTNKSIVTNVSGKNKIALKFPSNAASTSMKGEKVIDLTETFLADKKVVLVKRKDWDKVSGSSKDIIINKVGALYKTATAASMSVDNTKKTNTASTKKSTPVLKVTPTGSAKRPSSTQETTAKKKPEQKKPMMLQDFDIDDFDDIIELE